MKGLACGAAQGLRFQPQTIEWDGGLAIDAQAMVGAVDALHGVADRVELAAVDVRNDAFDFMFARPLGRVVGVLQQRFARRFHLRLVLQLRFAPAPQVNETGSQQVRQHDTLIL